MGSKDRVLVRINGYVAVKVSEYERLLVIEARYDAQQHIEKELQVNDFKRPKIEDQIENWFTYHAPNNEQQNNYQAIRDSAKEFALVLVANTPPSADQSAAIRKVREAVMTANAAVACEEKA